MARDILGGFGPNSRQPQVAGVDDGGIMPDDTVDVMNYKPPQGPKNIMDPKSPGLHGANRGTTNGPDSAGGQGGSPGIGVTNHGCCGSQGRY
jgi:hypothetical protein